MTPGVEPVTLLSLLRLAGNHGITVDSFPIRNRALALDMDGIYFIALRPHLSYIDKKEALAHELGHVFTRGFYSIHTPLRTIGYIETAADRWSFSLLLPLPWIKDRMTEGYQYIWEFAETAAVSESFAKSAFDYYRVCGKL